ncbi:MAG: hypothetical protein P1V81_05905 [Planctomycetota bacterium]|nr:hypothetical protein [Planctomycetota bacterium]
MKHVHLTPLLAASLLLASSAPAAAQATASQEKLPRSAAVETLLTESDLVGQFGGSYLDGLDLAAMSNGDVIFAGNGASSNTAIYHLETATGKVTRVVDTLQIQQAAGYAIGGSQWIDIDAVNVDLAGNIYILLHGWDWLLQGPANLSVLRVPLSGAAPGGYGAPVQLFNKPHGIFGEIAMDMDVFGTLHLVVDDGDPAADAGAGFVPNGIYTMLLGTTVPAPLATYASIAPVLSDGGPNLTGVISTHEDIGAGNIAAGLFKTYVTMSETANSALSWDTTKGEVHDGDIVEIDQITGESKLLISKRRYLEVSNHLFHLDRPLGPLGTDIRDISLAVDIQRNRLYTWENDYSSQGPYRHLSLLQWDLTTGEFEKLVLHHAQVAKPWLQAGAHPLGGSFTIYNLAPRGNVMSMAPDGSILVYLQAYLADGGDRILRITPADL